MSWSVDLVTTAVTAVQSNPYHPRHYYQPETQEDVEAIVADCAAAKRRLRVVGSGLSPNAIGFSDEGMMSMALLDKVVWVNPDTLQVRGSCVPPAVRFE